MPPEAHRGAVPGLLYWSRPPETTGDDDQGHEKLSLTCIKETGMCLLGLGRILQEIFVFMSIASLLSDVTRKGEQDNVL